jgi:hypothetical protein
VGLKLKKLDLPALATIEAMSQDQLLSLTKEWRERIEVYEGLLFKARRRMYGRSSERSESQDEKTAPTLGLAAGDWGRSLNTRAC